MFQPQSNMLFGSSNYYILLYRLNYDWSDRHFKELLLFKEGVDSRYRIQVNFFNNYLLNNNIRMERTPFLNYYLRTYLRTAAFIYKIKVIEKR